MAKIASFQWYFHQMTFKGKIMDVYIVLKTVISDNYIQTVHKNYLFV